MLSAVFLDRDGVINQNREDYVKSLDELIFLPGAIQAMARLTGAGFRLVVVSNQQGVGRGLISRDVLDDINDALRTELAAVGSKVAGIYYCPHLKEDNCSCRKPKPGLLLQAASDLGFDVTNAVFIGDSPGDVDAGLAAGCRTVLTLSGKTTDGDTASLMCHPHHVVADLSEAADLILERFSPDI
jgi:D-glycero-D-manno-heptose 1,7-bisphosphate phosphatase